MKNKSKITVIWLFFLILLALLAVPSQDVLAIGQMTKEIVIKDVLRGTEITDGVVLLNSENKNIVVELKAGGDIENWTYFYNIEDKSLENPINQIEIPSASYLDVVVKFAVPEDMPNGEYKGIISVLTIAEENKEDDSNVSLRQKIDREVSITVTDKEIIEFNTDVVPLKYQVELGEPLKIKLIYENNGNILVKPDIQVKIIKSGQTVFNAIFPYPEEEPGIKPKARKELNYIEWQTAGQEQGFYKAEIKVMLNGEAIQEEDFPFAIGFEQTNKFLAAISFIGFGSLTRGWFVVGAVLLLVAGILIHIKRKSAF